MDVRGQARFVHGDLHLGNWIVGPEGNLTLLDFQRARRTRSWRARLRDLADLDL
ncbi:MAG: phosphotransferase, partial [Phycisphaerales bacterium]|nr:phosphotransferase [Phycisphaerales bacterium]